MFKNIKEHIGEIIEIANKCPDKYQVKCFEVLLEALTRNAPSSIGVPTPVTQGSAQKLPDFFNANDIKEDSWQKIFYYDGKAYSIIVKDLKEKTVSGKQIKLGLLLGIKNLLETGKASIQKDSLIALCKEHSAFDGPNFSTNMKNKKNLFLQESTKDTWVLTIPGQQKAAEAIKDLA